MGCLGVGWKEHCTQLCYLPLVYSFAKCMYACICFTTFSKGVMIDPINGTTATVHEPGKLNVHCSIVKYCLIHTCMHTYIHYTICYRYKVMVANQDRSTIPSGLLPRVACGRVDQAASLEGAV